MKLLKNRLVFDAVNSKIIKEMVEKLTWMLPCSRGQVVSSHLLKKDTAMNVLGIETSCDETAVAIVNENRQILSHQIASQIAIHQPYGGVVPEVAARAHLQKLTPMVKENLEEAKLSWSQIDAIAATAGPGLIGGVMVGVMTAKALALSLNVPFLAINHLEGHALVARFTDKDIDFPYLLLLVSGGHCQLLVVKGVGVYELYGTTVDDAVGEAFDKVAKMMGLPYPGGPAIEEIAKQGDARYFDLPRPMYGKPHCDFSFSGLKTAVRRKLEQHEKPYSDTLKADMAASFQQAVVGCLLNRVERAILRFKQTYPKGRHFVVAGGVASNQNIREALKKCVRNNNLLFSVAPAELCTDNGVMIAWAGVERFSLGLVDNLSFKPRPRWALTQIESVI